MTLTKHQSLMSTVSKVKPKTAECIRHVQLQATGKAKRCFTLNAVAPPPTTTSPPLPPPIECPADVVFVLDESGSIGSRNLDQMKSFLSRLVSRLDMDSGNTRVGLVTFSGSVGTSINLDAHSSVASLQSAISSLGYAEGATNTEVNPSLIQELSV